MKKPNFFIIGAPKCGTTSLAYWLAEHPNIYMSPIKEPNFFNTDDRWTVTRSLRQYEALFRGANADHIAVGEASVWYLFSQDAVPNILKHVERPRFIVVIRNPVEMAYSFHQQEIYSGNEHVKDFYKAWDLQPMRAEGLEISRFCVEPRRLQYGQACRLGEQLERLYKLVLKEDVLVPVLDDVKKDTRTEYVRTLYFLGVSHDDPQVFGVYGVCNAAKARRSPLLGTFLTQVSRGVGRAKRVLGIQRGLGVLTAINRANRVEHTRARINGKIRGGLASYFSEDIMKLPEILERDMYDWLEVGDPDSQQTRRGCSDDEPVLYSYLSGA